MTGTKIALAGMAFASLAQVPTPGADVLQLYKDGGIALLAIIGIIYLYKDGKKRQDKLEGLIERACGVMQNVADSTRNCPSKQWDGVERRDIDNKMGVP